VRVAETAAVPTALSPALTIYRPDGSVQASTYGSTVASASFAAPVAGTYTVVVYDQGGTDVGGYRVYYTKAPGAGAGGELPVGGSVAGSLARGELASYTLTVGAGEGVFVRVAETAAVPTALSPALTIYRPDGSVQASTYGSTVASASFAAPVAGTYTVVVYDVHGPEVGDYLIRREAP
jgi:hypothetical protein